MVEASVHADCPTEEALAAFALGKLDEAERSALEAHLDGCETCQYLAADVAHTELFASAPTAPVGSRGELDWNTTFPRGTLVGGRYEIRRFIARGGMGEVYEAYDRVLSERVALKTVNSTASDDARAVRRLKAEVQLARLVSHPNVCRIYDVGTHAHAGTRAELHFLTMQFVEGETLGQRVRLAGALPFVEAKKLARELLLALRAAHEAGVLHRDFKSDNVMLKGASEGLSTAVVLDFGLARALDGEPHASTSHPNLVGTFGYIAPEHFQGQGYSIASDLYAFGVVWYEMLTGQLPFDAPSGPRLTRPRQLAFGASIVPPSTLNPEVPRALDALVLRCLERAPEKRFESVGALLDAIAEATEGPALRRRRALFLASSIVTGLVAAAALLLVRGVSVGTHRVAEPTAMPRAPSPSPAAELQRADDARPTPVAGDESAPPALLPKSPSAPRLAAPGRLAPDMALAPPLRTSAKAPPRAATSSPLPASVRDIAQSGGVAAPEAPAPVRAPKKTPDWENPFGPSVPSELAAGAQSPRCARARFTRALLRAERRASATLADRAFGRARTRRAFETPFRPGSRPSAWTCGGPQRSARSSFPREAEAGRCAPRPKGGRAGSDPGKPR